MTYCDPNAIFCWPILFMTIRSATGPSKLSLTGCSLLGASKISKQDSETWPQTLFFSSSNSNTYYFSMGWKKKTPFCSCLVRSLPLLFLIQTFHLSLFPCVVEGLREKLAKKSIKLHRKAHHTYQKVFLLGLPILSHYHGGLSLVRGLGGSVCEGVCLAMHRCLVHSVSKSKPS